MDMISSIEFTNSSWLILLPSILMATDIFTGLVYAWSRKKFKSSVMREGLGKKIGELVAVGIANLICYATNIPDYIAIGVTSYVTLMEGMSICENLKKLGIRIPIIDKLLADANKQNAVRKGDAPNERNKRISNVRPK